MAVGGRWRSIVSVVNIIPNTCSIKSLSTCQEISNRPYTTRLDQRDSSCSLEISTPNAAIREIQDDVYDCNEDKDT